MELLWDMGPNPKRVRPGEDIAESLDRIPFLKQFRLSPPGIDEEGMTVIFLSSVRVNEYMGFTFLEKGANATSESINKVLEEAERRGDI